MKPEAPVPVEPFATWPVQHYEPDVGFYWFIEPSTLVCQTIAPHGSLSVIDRHNDVGMQPPARGKPLA
jgi:hypothetical protein